MATRGQPTASKTAWLQPFLLKTGPIYNPERAGGQEQFRATDWARMHHGGCCLPILAIRRLAANRFAVLLPRSVAFSRRATLLGPNNRPRSADLPARFGNLALGALRWVGACRWAISPAGAPGPRAALPPAAPPPPHPPVLPARPPRDQAPVARRHWRSSPVSALCGGAISPTPSRPPRGNCTDSARRRHPAERGYTDQPRHVARVSHRNPLLHTARHLDYPLLGHHPAHLVRARAGLPRARVPVQVCPDGHGAIRP